MKIKINSIMKNVYGEPLKSQRKKKKEKPEDPDIFEDMILKDAIVNSLLGDYPDEKGLSGEEKLKRYRLAMKIQDAKVEIDLVSDDIVLIKKLIAKSWSPLISGQAWEIIEPG